MNLKFHFEASMDLLGVNVTVLCCLNETKLLIITLFCWFFNINTVATETRIESERNPNCTIKTIKLSDVPLKLNYLNYNNRVANLSLVTLVDFEVNKRIARATISHKKCYCLHYDTGEMVVDW